LLFSPQLRQASDLDIFKSLAVRRVFSRLIESEIYGVVCTQHQKRLHDEYLESVEAWWLAWVGRDLRGWRWSWANRGGCSRN
jgi:hypothetical protein